MKRTSQRVTHSLTSELQEKLLMATHEIISLASRKSYSNFTLVPSPVLHRFIAYSELIPLYLRQI